MGYKLSIEIAFHAIEFFMGMIDWTTEGAEGAEVEKRERFEIDYKLSAHIAFHAIEFFMGMIDW